MYNLFFNDNDFDIDKERAQRIMQYNIGKRDEIQKNKHKFKKAEFEEKNECIDLIIKLLRYTYKL